MLTYLHFEVSGGWWLTSSVWPSVLHVLITITFSAESHCSQIQEYDQSPKIPHICSLDVSLKLCKLRFSPFWHWSGRVRTACANLSFPQNQNCLQYETVWLVTWSYLLSQLFPKLCKLCFSSQPFDTLVNIQTARASQCKKKRKKKMMMMMMNMMMMMMVMMVMVMMMMIAAGAAAD